MTVDGPTIQSSSQPDNIAQTASMTASCPICYQVFPVSVIASHAEVCAHDSFDPVGEVLDDELLEIVSSYEDDILTNEHVPDSSIPPKSYKQGVEELQKKIDTSKKVKINIRRKYLFKDYVEIRKKPWFRLDRLFKVVFIGEPAEDDGGPRREFFSGLLRLINIIQ